MCRSHTYSHINVPKFFFTAAITMVDQIHLGHRLHSPKIHPPPGIHFTCTSCVCTRTFSKVCLVDTIHSIRRIIHSTWLACLLQTCQVRCGKQHLEVVFFNILRLNGFLAKQWRSFLKRPPPKHVFWTLPWYLTTYALYYAQLLLYTSHQIMATELSDWFLDN